MEWPGEDLSDVADVAAAVQANIVQGCPSAALRALLVQLMSRPGRALAEVGPWRWPAFVLQTARALGGRPQAAVWAAAAVEFAVTAIDVVDDLIDGEWPGPPERALNASLALAWLSQLVAGELVGELGAERARQLATLLLEGGLTSYSGQDLDLLLEAAADASQAQAYQMTRWKAGALVAMACQAGAVVAGADRPLLDLVGEFGAQIGVIEQLLNDLDGVAPERDGDLRRHKKTLPIVYLLDCAREEGWSDLLQNYEQPSGPDGTARLAHAVRELGGLHYTWVVAMAHRTEALRLLRQLSHDVGADAAERLRVLVPEVQLVCS